MKQPSGHILGYSGLHHSSGFLKREFPNRPAILRYFSQGADSAAALLTAEGRVFAAAEERFSRVKATGAFPVRAMEFCRQAAGLRWSEIEAVAHGFSYEPYREPFTRQGEFFARQFEEVYAEKLQLQLLEAHFPDQSLAEKLIPVPHHLAHAASAFLPSGFSDSLILVADGMGESACTTVAVGSEAGIEIIKQIPASDSLGIFYAVLTCHLGFCMGRDEYKVMGLAPYGDARVYFSKLMELVSLKEDGTFTIPFLSRGDSTTDRQMYRGALDLLQELFGPARCPDESIETKHRDLAAALQAVLQTALLHALKVFKRETGQIRLCLAGGVALNCTANGAILRSRLFRQMFVQAAAGDDGTALGAALYVAHQRGGPSHLMKPPFWGPSFGSGPVRSDLTREAARRLARGEVLGWFQGAMEFGPRALGNRSILADPRDPRMRDRVNQLVKKREGFRPFAPAVTEEAAERFFEIRKADIDCFCYMLFVAMVRPEYREKLPAVTHVDGSARVQVVSKKDNPKFWALLKAFEQESGLPILLNTSFNVKGEPIVCTPEDARRTFETAKLDALVIEDTLLAREQAGV